MTELFLRLLAAKPRLILGAVSASSLLAAMAAFAAHERHVQQLADVRAEAGAHTAAMAANAAAQARADQQRISDLARTAALEKDLKDAYHDIPATPPSAARLALACRRLRAQHADLHRVPQCHGSAG